MPLCEGNMSYAVILRHKRTFCSRKHPNSSHTVPTQRLSLVFWFFHPVFFWIWRPSLFFSIQNLISTIMTSLASVLPFLGAKNPSSAKQGVRESSHRTPRGARRAMDDGSNRHQLSSHATRRGPAFGRSQTTADANRRGPAFGRSQTTTTGSRTKSGPSC